AMLTEGITWVMTGIGIGMALGSFAAGAMVDAFGAQSGFWVSVASGTIALATVLLGQRSLATTECEMDGCEAAAIAAE
ncbi:MFS transporter, partial [Mesorhizobium sp. M7A.F.Ca.MR.362.00.0.0]